MLDESNIYFDNGEFMTFQLMVFVFANISLAQRNELNYSNHDMDILVILEDNFTG